MTGVTGVTGVNGRNRAGHVAHVVLVLLLLAGVLLASDAPVAHAQDEPATAESASNLQAMLAHVPADLPELDGPDRAVIAYADIAAQLNAVAVEAPDSMNDDGFEGWMAATMGLPVPVHAAQFLSSWRQDYGFDLLQADQTLHISSPPFDLSLYRGRFDPATVASTLGELGYRPIEAPGGPMLSIRGDFEQDLRADPAYLFAAMNYAALLDDGTLVFASAQAIVDAVLEVQAGEAPSLAERSDVEALLPHAPADLASALFVPGGLLAGGLPTEVLEVDPNATPAVDAIATEMAEEAQMPPVALALLGVTAGDVPDARAVVVLLMLGPAAAEDAVPIVDERLATGSSNWAERSYAELFPEWTVEAVTESPIVLIELTLGEETSRANLMQMLSSRDLGFIAW